MFRSDSEGEGRCVATIGSDLENCWLPRGLPPSAVEMLHYYQRTCRLFGH